MERCSLVVAGLGAMDDARCSSISYWQIDWRSCRPELLLLFCTCHRHRPATSLPGISGPHACKCACTDASIFLLIPFYAGRHAPTLHTPLCMKRRHDLPMQPELWNLAA